MENEESSVTKNSSNKRACKEEFSQLRKKYVKSHVWTRQKRLGVKVPERGKDT